MAAPNLAGPMSIIGKNSVNTIPLSSGDVPILMAAVGQCLKINTAIFCNDDSMNSTNVMLWIHRGSNNAFIVCGTRIGASTSLVAVDKDAPLYLEENDSLHAENLGSSIPIDLNISYEEIS